MAINVEIRNTPENGIEAIWTGSQDEPLRPEAGCVFIDKLSLEDWLPIPTRLLVEGLMEDFAYREKQ